MVMASGWESKGQGFEPQQTGLDLNQSGHLQVTFDPAGCQK